MQLDDAIGDDLLSEVFANLDLLELGPARSCSKSWRMHADFQQSSMADFYGGKIIGWSDAEEELGAAFHRPIPCREAAFLCLLRLRRFKTRHPHLSIRLGKVRSIAAHAAATDDAEPWACTAVLYDTCLTVLGEGGSVRCIWTPNPDVNLCRVRATESNVYILYTNRYDGDVHASALRLGII